MYESLSAARQALRGFHPHDFLISTILKPCLLVYLQKAGRQVLRGFAICQP